MPDWQADPVVLPKPGSWQDDPLVQQPPQGPANAPGTPDLPSFGEQGAQYAPDTLTPQNEAGLEQQFSQEHPYIYGVAKGITGMVPKSLDEVKQMLRLPMPSHDVAQEQAASDQLGASWRGEYGPTEQAASITGTALQALPLLGLGSAESPFRATPSDAALVEQFRQAQAAEKPPVQPEAPPAWASDPVVSETAKVQAPQEPDIEAANKALQEYRNSQIDQRLQGVEVPKPQAGKVTGAPNQDEFGKEITPVASYIMGDLGGVVSKSAAAKLGKLKDNTDLWNDAGGLSHPTHNKIYNPSGVMPDVAATELYSAGLIPDPYVSTMWEALRSESKTARGALAEQRRQFIECAKQLPTVEQVNKALAQDLPPERPPVTIPVGDAKYAGIEPSARPDTGQFQASDSQAGQRDVAPAESASVGSSEVGRIGAPERPGSGTSNRAFSETYGQESVPSGEGVDTAELLDNARAAVRSGAVDPYNVLSRTRANGIANAEEYAALAAEHERLVNDAVAKQKAGAPDAPQAAKAAEDFANAIQPHKTAASDLMRLFQGDIDYDLSTPFGMDQYMKAEIGRGIKSGERPRFDRMSSDIGRAQTDVQQAVARSDVRVQRHYANVRDIPIEEAAARVKEWLKDCVV